MCSVSGAYNPNLILHKLAEGLNPSGEIVTNDITFGESGRVFVLTGPNMGGKTVYTKMAGLIQIMF